MSNGQQFQREQWVRRIQLTAAGVLVLGSAVWTYVAAGQDTIRTWDAFIAALTVVVLAAALFAAALAWGPYSDWIENIRRLPQIGMFAMSTHDAAVPPTRVDSGKITLVGMGVYAPLVLQVVIRNTGDAAADVALNIVVPAIGFAIKPIDPPPKVHYAAPLPSNDARLGGPALYTVGRAQCLPGDTTFHVEIVAPADAGEYTMGMELQGEHLPPECVWMPITLIRN